MSIVEYKNPSFLEGVSAQAIQQKIMANLPANIDKVEGGFVWDLTYPSALEKAELLEYHLVCAIKTFFHMWAQGRWLDEHAHDCGLERKAANKAYGSVTVTGVAGTEIPAGFVFSVPAESGEPAIDYETIEAAEISSDGTIDIAVQAVEAGKKSNITRDTITIMRDPMRGITHITNPEPITGGAEAEDDESLRQRIDDALAGKGDSFVGNNADYVRWAMEVPGVGYAHTIPEYNGPNSVKLVVTDMDGLPANEQICENVFIHIFGTNRKDPLRLAPVGVIDFVVAPPAPVAIDYSLHVKLKEGATKEAAIESIRKAFFAYYKTVTMMASTVKPVKYVEISSCIDRDTVGIADFKKLRMNGGLDNVIFAEDEYPVTGAIEVTLYE